jgi:predicted metalloendopeptidase
MKNLPLFLLLAACSGSSKSTPPPAPAEAPEPEATASLESEVSASMNPDVGACEDFYEYACGGWTASTELPADRTLVSRSFTTIFDDNQEVIRTILEKAAESPGEDLESQKLGAFYASCMDTETIEARGTKPVTPWLEKIDAVGSVDEAVKLAGELQDFGPNPFFGIAAWADDKQPDTNILVMAQDGLGLPDRSYYFPEDEKGEQLLADYEAHIAKMFALFGEEEGQAQAMAADVLKFESELAELHWERSEMRDSEKVYNKKTYAELQELAEGIDFDGYFAGAGMEPPEVVNVMTPSVFEGLPGLLEAHPVEVLQSYLRWHLISWSAPYLTAEIDAADFAFFATKLSGQTEQQPRWKRCVTRTNGAMGEWLGKKYVELRFAGESKAMAEEMVDGIFDAFRGNLPALVWMDDETRAKAVEKANAFIAKLGYPNKWKDYSAVAVGEDTHFENVVSGNLAATAEMEAKVGQPVDKDEWHMTPQMVNAYYNPPQNEIVFPAGIMQAPFFDKDFPRAFNYGALGMVIGHEITHGFDDEGRKYAPTGELKEWWAPEVAEKFEEAAQCVEEQYAGFTVADDLPVDGKLTLGENIADLGGLKIAHLAYLDWVEENGEEPELAGLTGEQQLFVAFAQGWCTVATPEIEKLRVKTDPHSPPRFRVNGPVMNYPGFAKAFGCEEGDPMAPPADEVCTVW